MHYAAQSGAPSHWFSAPYSRIVLNPAMGIVNPAGSPLRCSQEGAVHAYTKKSTPIASKSRAYALNADGGMIVQQFRCWTHVLRISDPLNQRQTPDPRNRIAPYVRPATDLQGDL